MATSKGYILNNESLQTLYGENNYATIQRTPTIPIPQSQINSAASSGNLNSDGTINYANVFSKGKYELLGASETFARSLATDPSYWTAFNQSVDGASINTAFSNQTTDFLVSPFISRNTDSNGSSSLGNFPNLRYPIKNDGNFDFLKITCYEYVSNQFINNAGNNSLQEASKRITKSLFNVALPMQPGISESSSVGWGEDRLNAIQIAAAGLAGKAIQDLSNIDPMTAATNFMSGLDESVRKVLRDSGMNESAIATYFAGQAVGANIFARGTGQVLNPNLELLFTGPNLRTFNYTYRFTPREPGEADAIKSIIRLFKQNMAPKKTSTSLFLKTPNVFKLKYIFANGTQHPFLNNIKLCALTGFTVDYTPDGSYMTYSDGSMTSYQVSMQFNELDPIYFEDYAEGEGQQGMGY